MTGYQAGMIRDIRISYTNGDLVGRCDWRDALALALVSGGVLWIGLPSGSWALCTASWSQ